MPDMEQVMQELVDFGQLQTALEQQELLNIGRQLQAEHAYRKLMLSRYGIAQAFAPEDGDDE